MENTSDYYILQTKVESLQIENNKLKHEIQNLKKLIGHMLEGKNIPSNLRKIIDN
jgi:hypothetical protein